MDRSPGFGSTPSNLIAHLRLAFATAPHLKCLTLLLNVTRWPVLQKVRGHTSNVLPQLVSAGFQVLFHSPPGVLFAFPSQYWFTIGRSRVFSLGGWSPHLQTGCHVSRPTYRFLSTTRPISHTGLSPSIAGLSRPFCCRSCYQNTGLLQFRSPLLSQSRLISFPGAT